jgi:hypothetical protein
MRDRRFGSESRANLILLARTIPGAAPAPTGLQLCSTLPVCGASLPGAIPPNAQSHRTIPCAVFRVAAGEIELAPAQHWQSGRCGQSRRPPAALRSGPPETATACAAGAAPPGGAGVHYQAFPSGFDLLLDQTLAGRERRRAATGHGIDVLSYALLPCNARRRVERTAQCCRGSVIIDPGSNTLCLPRVNFDNAAKACRLVRRCFGLRVPILQPPMDGACPAQGPRQL